MHATIFECSHVVFLSFVENDSLTLELACFKRALINFIKSTAHLQYAFAFTQVIDKEARIVLIVPFVHLISVTLLFSLDPAAFVFVLTHV